jgi:hypothetical protein
MKVEKTESRFCMIEQDRDQLVIFSSETCLEIRLLLIRYHGMDSLYIHQNVILYMLGFQFKHFFFNFDAVNIC